MARARTKPSMDHTMIFYDGDDDAVVVDGDYLQCNERPANLESLTMDNQQKLNDQIDNVDDLAHQFHQTTINNHSGDQYCPILSSDHTGFNDPDNGGCDQSHSIQSLIHYAAINNQIDLIQKILANNRQNDTDWHSLVNCLDSESNTPLLVASSNGHREMVRFLLEHGSLVNAQNCFDNTSLHEAAWKGFSETLEILCNHQPSTRRTNRMGDPLETNLKLHLKNKQGHTALHLAAQKGHNQSTRILLLAGCRANVKNNFGDTPLHSASRYGHVGVCRILISAFANVNELNKNDDTALHIAAAMDRKKLVKILLETGCNPTIVNRQGETPMNIALRKSYFDIQELIASPPPLKSKYLNTSNSNLWCGQQRNPNRFEKQRPCSSGHLGMMMTKSDTYSYDQLNYAHAHYNHHAQAIGQSHNNHDGDGDLTDQHKLWPTVTTKAKMKRCKSDFSTSNHHRHHHHHHPVNYRNVTTTPTTQASSQHEYRKKRHGKRRTLDALNNDVYAETQLDDDDVQHSPYGAIGRPSNHHQPYHRSHLNSPGSNSHHYELTAPKLETLPREPLKKGERYYMDLAGHIHKGPIIGDEPKYEPKLPFAQQPPSSKSKPQNMLKSMKTVENVLMIDNDQQNVNYLQNARTMRF